ncbi:MAG: hypothetical protein ACN6OQ_23930, partial [Paraburkholderia nemoris]
SLLGALPGIAQPSQKRFDTLLAARLPSYMIPSELLACRSLPVSVNFKIDRAQLAQDYRDVHFKAQRQHNA